MSDDDFGVSPVIGVVLLVALVVILAGVVGIVFFDIGGQDRNPGLQSGLVTDIEETPDGVEVSTLDSGSGGQILVDGEPVRNISEDDTGKTFVLDNVSEGSTVAIKPNESEDITQTETVSKNYSGGSKSNVADLIYDTQQQWTQKKGDLTWNIDILSSGAIEMMNNSATQSYSGYVSENLKIDPSSINQVEVSFSNLKEGGDIMISGYVNKSSDSSRNIGNSSDEIIMFSGSNIDESEKTITVDTNVSDYIGLETIHLVQIRPNDDGTTPKVDRLVFKTEGDSDGPVGLINIDTESEWVDSENTSASSGFDIKSDIDDGYIEAVNGQGVYYGNEVEFSKPVKLNNVTFNYDAEDASNKIVGVTAIVSGDGISNKMVGKEDGSVPLYTSGSGQVSYKTNITNRVDTIKPVLLVKGNQSNGTAAEIFSVNYNGDIISDLVEVTETKNIVLKTDEQWSQGNFTPTDHIPTELSSVTIKQNLTAPKVTYSCCYNIDSINKYYNIKEDETFYDAYYNSAYVDGGEIEWTPEYKVGDSAYSSGIIYMLNDDGPTTDTGRVFAYDLDGNKLFNYSPSIFSDADFRGISADETGVYYNHYGFNNPSSYLVKLDTDGNVIWNNSITSGNGITLVEENDVIFAPGSTAYNTSTGDKIQSLTGSIGAVDENNNIYTDGLYNDFSDPFIKKYSWNGSQYVQDWSNDTLNGRIYTIDSELYVKNGNTLHRLNPDNGNEIWRTTHQSLKNLNSPNLVSPAYNSSHINYLIPGGPSETKTDIFQINRQSGEIDKLKTLENIEIPYASGNPENAMVNAYTSGGDTVEGVLRVDLTEEEEWIAGGSTETAYYYSKEFNFNGTVEIQNMSIRIKKLENADSASVSILVSDSSIPEFESLSLNSITGAGVWVHPANSTKGKEYYNIQSENLGNKNVQPVPGTNFRIQIALSTKSPSVEPPKVESINITGKQTNYK
jgi:FlaG/FlaF family flagellin (archaellin)